MCDPIEKVSFAAFFAHFRALSLIVNVMFHNIFQCFVVSSRVEIGRKNEKSTTRSDFRYESRREERSCTRKKWLNESKVSLIQLSNNSKGSNEHFHSKKQTSWSRAARDWLSKSDEKKIKNYTWRSGAAHIWELFIPQHERHAESSSRVKFWFWFLLILLFSFAFDVQTSTSTRYRSQIQAHLSSALRWRFSFHCRSGPAERCFQCFPRSRRCLMRKKKATKEMGKKEENCIKKLAVLCIDF